jgi:hypothetical protein
MLDTAETDKDRIGIQNYFPFDDFNENSWNWLLWCDNPHEDIPLDHHSLDLRCGRIMFLDTCLYTCTSIGGIYITISMCPLLWHSFVQILIFPFFGGKKRRGWGLFYPCGSLENISSTHAKCETPFFLALPTRNNTKLKKEIEI